MRITPLVLAIGMALTTSVQVAQAAESKQESRQMQLNPFSQASSLPFQAPPVSYTHLDVYKRQAISLLFRPADLSVAH
ncbi:hypothetical protein [Erwinia amylovora]